MLDFPLSHDADAYILVTKLAKKLRICMMIESGDIIDGMKTYFIAGRKQDVRAKI